MDAGAAVALAGKAAGTVFDVTVYDVNHVDFLLGFGLHAVQKCPGDAQSVALIPLGTSVQYENLHRFHLLDDGIVMQCISAFEASNLCHQYPCLRISVTFRSHYSERKVTRQLFYKT